MNRENSKRWNRTLWIGFLTVAAIFFLMGYWAGRPAEDTGETSSREAAVQSYADRKAGAPSVWTCSMHPQIRLPKPGLCPICAMDLIPEIDDAGETLMLGEIRMSPRAMKLAVVRTRPVERKYVARELRLVGKVTPDEKRVGVISAWVPGRIDRMFVDYTGIRVNKGDHLVELYSPDLFAVQEELIQAANAVRSGSQNLKSASERRLQAAQEKLRLYGLSAWQIRQIEKKGKPSDRLTIYSPMGGIVTRKQAVEGMYVKTGTPVYTIADLSQVWVKLDAYESDLSWLRYGQQVTFEAESYPITHHDRPRTRNKGLFMH